jgi:plastocyanin
MHNTQVEERTMPSYRQIALMILPFAIVGLLMLSGCGSGDEKSAGKTKKASTKKEGGSTGGATASGKAEELKVSGTASSLKGLVTYKGTDQPGPAMQQPTKDQASCPKEIPGAGWYVNSSNQGLQYAVVFLKAPAGTKLPKSLDPGAPAAEFVDVKQPHCQFEPRVQVMHPKQKIRFLNDSDPAIQHDANLDNGLGGKFQSSLKPGDSKEFSPETSDNAPYAISCQIHTGMMSGWLWRPSHHLMAVTDANGNFEIKDVPVPADGKKWVVAVWHEKLPGNRVMEIGEVEVKAGEPATMNFSMPTK